MAWIVGPAYYDRTVHLDRAVQALRRHQPVDDNLLSHLSPLGWHHINLTGDYSWAHDKQPMPGKVRALRTAPETPTRGD